MRVHTPALPWQDAPRLDRAAAALRHSVALWTDQHGTAGAIRMHDDLLSVELSSPLPYYPLCIELQGAPGTLAIGVECAALYPELAADLLRAVGETEAVRIELLEWMLMPWLDRLEQALGCALRIGAATMGCVMPPEGVPLRLRAGHGGHAQLVIYGSALAWLAEAIPRPALAPWSWMRLPVQWVLRVPSLSARETRELQPGAMLLLERQALHFYLGHRQRRRLMTAQWNDQDNGATVLGPSQDLDAPIDSSARGGLLELDEIGFDIDVVLAHHTLSLSEASALCPGAVLELDRPIDGRHVSLTCNGRTFALGTLATLDERLAVVITECWGTRR